MTFVIGACVIGARQRQRVFTTGGTDRQQAGGLTKTREGTGMTQITELATPALARGRQIKFTPERIQQIKNLVERGTCREEIAELIGVTVGSLQVTCSRLGISLRRPAFNKTIGLLRRDDARFSRVSAPGSVSAGALLQLTKEAFERNSRPALVRQPQAPLRAKSAGTERMRRARRASPSRCSTGARSERLNCRSLRT